MAALTQDNKLEWKPGNELPYPVAANALIYGGALCALDSTGNLVRGSDTAGLKFAGVAVDRCDNSLGAAGAVTATVRRRGGFRCAIAAATQADVGKAVYAVDDQTVALAAGSTNKVYAGVIAGVIDGTHVWVDFDRAGVYPTT
jgi:hypothetical protein